MRSQFYCKEDENQFFKSYGEILKLFGRDIDKIMVAFQNRFYGVETYPFNYYEKDFNAAKPGKTGCIDPEDINSKTQIRLIGFNGSNRSKAQTAHYFSHELNHAFSVAAMDAFGNRTKIGVTKENVPIYQERTINNSKYTVISGSIYKEMEGNESENIIYGGGFCELMTDMYSALSRVGSSSEMKNKGITLDTVIKRPTKEWNIEGITTAYFPGMPLARLAIAAFSNVPEANYQNIFDSDYSIFANTQTDKGQNVKINDFIYGSMCNPFYIMDEYDKTTGKPGSYFELCEPVDRIVDCYSKRETPNKNDIKLAIKKLSNFAKLNTLIKVEEGVYSKEYAEKILDEFETIKADVEKEYGISNIQKSNNHSSITPSNITQTSHQVVQNNPGQLSDKVKKSKSIFSKILDKIKGRFRENR